MHRSPGRARHTPFQPLRREGRDVLATPVCRCADFSLQLRTVDLGCQRAPGLPCALFHSRVRRSGKARAKCAARMRAHVSHSTTLSCPGRCAARSDALQSRGPCVSVLCHLLGPGSAPHRYALRRVRDSREAGAAPAHSVIASAAKQSRIFPRRQSGLLRCARNDDVETAVHSYPRCRPGEGVASARMR